MAMHPTNRAGSEVEGFFFSHGVLASGKLLGQAQGVSHQLKGLRKDVGPKSCLRVGGHLGSKSVIVLLKKKEDLIAVLETTVDKFLHSMTDDLWLRLSRHGEVYES